MRTSWLLLAVLGCAAEEKHEEGGTEETEAEEKRLPPDGLGPFAVGTADITITGRTGVELVVQVWYPTEVIDNFLYSYLGAYTGLAQASPQPACARVRPLMAFSHGNTGLRWQSTFMTEYLATHGVVVVAPDHTGNTTLDNDESRKPELIFRRPWDISDSVDFLFESADLVVDGLGACMDPSGGFAVSGHSFGGYTTMAVAGARFDAVATQEHCDVQGGWLCDHAASHVAEFPDGDRDGADDRVWAAIPMAPAGLEVLVGGLADVDVPVMVLGGAMDDVTSIDDQVGPIYEALSASPRHLGVMADAGHFVFSNACDLISGQNEECEEPFISIEVAHPELAALITAYLRWVLGEEEMVQALPPTPEMWSWTSD